MTRTEPSVSTQKLTETARLLKQWHKLSGLHSRAEWSAAIIRAATAAELAANFVIRSEFALQTHLTEAFVDSLMRWANGLQGKMSHLAIPLVAHDGRKLAVLKAVLPHAQRVNDKRNAIVHQGEFCNATEAREAIADARHFIETIMVLYQPLFQLEKTSASGKRSRQKEESV